MGKDSANSNNIKRFLQQHNLFNERQRAKFNCLEEFQVHTQCFFCICPFCFCFLFLFWKKKSRRKKNYFKKFLCYWMLFFIYTFLLLIEKWKFKKQLFGKKREKKKKRDKEAKEFLFTSQFFFARPIGGSRGGRARCAPPHLPGILVFDDILGHIV